MENQNDIGWNIVSRKSQKTKPNFYKLDGTRLTPHEIEVNKELKKQHQLNKKNKGRKQKNVISMHLNQTTIFANNDTEDPFEHGYRLFTKEDNSLTPEETEMVKNAGHELSCCLCCNNTSLISNIIGRQVYSCGTCYCCIGDDPYGDICTVYVNDETRTLYITASNEKLKELSEYNTKYKKDYEKQTGQKYINTII